MANPVARSANSRLGFLSPPCNRTRHAEPILPEHPPSSPEDPSGLQHSGHGCSHRASFEVLANPLGRTAAQKQEQQRGERICLPR